MSLPTYIFIDTCIFDSQNYNFESTAFASFLAECSHRKIKLVLPDPVSREVHRHIKRRSDDVIKALEEAKRKAPFLAKWKEWPIKKPPVLLNYELQRLAQSEWESFLGHFEVVKLKYEGVDISQIMNWYDRKTPPFGEGKKSKEFPDAFCISALLALGRRDDCSIAVISADPDFKRACGLYSGLTYFHSLPAYTESLLQEDDRIKTLRTAIEDDPSSLCEAVKEPFSELHFLHEESMDADIEDVEVDDIELTEFSIVSIGEDEAVVVCEFRVYYSAHVRMDDDGSAIVDSSEGIYMALREFRGTVSDWHDISATLKLAVGGARNAIDDVVTVDIDDDTITVTEIPEDCCEKE